MPGSAALPVTYASSDESSFYNNIPLLEVKREDKYILYVREFLTQRDRERECVCVCVCVLERERENVRVCIRERERDSEKVRKRE